MEQTLSTRIELSNRVEWVNEQGDYHRLDGPAIEWKNGTKSWWINGKKHREDGPAVEWNNGTKHWILNGKCHREDGPAIEWKDGHKEWFINGELYSEQEYNKEMIKIRFKRIQNL